MGLIVAKTVWGALSVAVLAGSATALEMVRQIDASDPLAKWQLVASPTPSRRKQKPGNPLTSAASVSIGS